MFCKILKMTLEVQILNEQDPEIHFTEAFFNKVMVVKLEMIENFKKQSVNYILTYFF